MSKAEETRNYIIEQAAPVFNMYGYKGTTLSQLTKVINMTKGAIYGNFRDKDEITLLDTLPQRFPTNTGTGLELKVLPHIFSPEEAEMAIQLQPMPELPAAIAKRIGKDPEESEALLLEMSKKGQI
jgi:hypothetical protein